MEITIEINDLPPMPRNRSHMVISKPRPMLIKTPICREFEKDLKNRLKEYIEVFLSFRGNFNPLTNYIKATYVIYTPPSLLFTKQGSISSKSSDSDSHKVMRDVLYECLGLDDKLERDSRFLTPVSKDENWNYLIYLSIQDTDNLRE